MTAATAMAVSVERNKEGIGRERTISYLFFPNIYLVGAAPAP